MVAGELNRIVNIEVWGYTQNASGSAIGSITNSWNQRAKVEDRSGSQFVNNAQHQWAYDAKITVRVTPNAIESNNTLIYEGYRYTINSVSINTEGKKRWYVLRCSKKEVWQALN